MGHREPMNLSVSRVTWDIRHMVNRKPCSAFSGHRPKNIGKIYMISSSKKSDLGVLRSSTNSSEKMMIEKVDQARYD